MRGGPLLVSVMLLTAGCLGSDAEPDAAEDAAPQPSPTQPATIAAPGNWSLGRHWTYDGGLFGTNTYVVTGDAGSSWMVETNSPELAFFDADDDLSWLGPIAKGTLAGSENGQAVEYFRFPLEANKTWTTPWDGTTMTITVTDVEDGVATLEAVRESGLWVRYTYDASIEWFGDRIFFDETGNEVFVLTYARDGFGFTGNIARWTLETLFEREGAITATPDAWNEQFEVGEGVTDVWLEFDAVCPSGVVRLEIVAVDSPANYPYGDQCPLEVESQQVVMEAPPPGRWEVGFAADSPQGDGEYDVTMLLRTLELTPFG